PRSSPCDLSNSSLIQSPRTSCGSPDSSQVSQPNSPFAKNNIKPNNKSREADHFLAPNRVVSPSSSPDDISQNFYDDSNNIKIRKLDNGSLNIEEESKDSLSNDDAVQTMEELDQELKALNNQWDQVIKDLQKCEKYYSNRLDNLIIRAENLEHSWNAKKEVLAQKLKVIIS
ncbi:uncharacterized protein LOC115216247, partial [Argonauta hians]